MNIPALSSRTRQETVCYPSNGGGGNRTRDQSSDSKDLQQSIALNQQIGGEKQGEIDPDLQKLIDAWPSLSEHTKSAILSRIDALESGVGRDE